MSSLKKVFNGVCAFGYKTDATPIIAITATAYAVAPMTSMTSIATAAAAISAGHVADATIGKAHNEDMATRTGRYVAIFSLMKTISTYQQNILPLIIGYGFVLMACEALGKEIDKKRMEIRKVAETAARQKIENSLPPLFVPKKKAENHATPLLDKPVRSPQQRLPIQPHTSIRQARKGYPAPRPRISGNR
ncbi:MAG TPA: hypothetical protein DCW68_04595 [Rhodospirillaceae bacterium]|nr:MAG: hypothetical protein A2018_03055 [Alphaproteobacteria bacterium GWF2_58_20]HAU29375.1 hypothetical protein [Rhodospirillaceae bacterium]